MAAPTQSEMHAEHSLWSNEHSKWRDDIKLGREEHQKMMAGSNQIEEFLSKHERALETYRAALERHEVNEKEHEEAFAAQVPGVENKNLDRLASLHHTEAEHHRRQCEAHEEMKKYQHMVVDRWSLLFKGLQEAMQSSEIFLHNFQAGEVTAR